MKAGLWRWGAVVSLVALTGLSCKTASPANRASSEVINDMKMAMVKVQSASYHFTASGNGDVFSVPATGMAQTPDSFTLNLDGQTKRGDKNVADASGTFSVQATGAQPLALDGEYRTVQGVNYVKINTLPTIKGLDLKSLANVWIALPANTTDATAKATQQELSKEQIAQLEQLFKETNFFSSVDKSGAEEIHGMNTDIYTVRLDGPAIAAAAEQSAKIQGKELSAKEKADVLTTVEQLNVKPGRLWISSTDQRLYGMEFHLVKDQDGKTSEATVRLELWDFDKATAAVDAPKDAKNVADIIAGFMGQAMGGMMKNMGMPSGSGMPALTPEQMQQLEQMKNFGR